MTDTTARKRGIESISGSWRLTPECGRESLCNTFVTLACRVGQIGKSCGIIKITNDPFQWCVLAGTPRPQFKKTYAFASDRSQDPEIRRAFSLCAAFCTKLTRPQICLIHRSEVRAVSSAGLEQGTSNSQVGGSSPPRLATLHKLLQRWAQRMGFEFVGILC